MDKVWCLKVIIFLCVSSVLLVCSFAQYHKCHASASNFPDENRQGVKCKKKQNRDEYEQSFQPKTL